jgi:two-component system sensor histidine kinase RegB
MEDALAARDFGTIWRPNPDRGGAPARRPWALRVFLPAGAAKPAMHASSIQAAANKKNLLLLVALRWLAVAGQIATVLFVRYWLDIPLPLPAMGGVILFLVALNFIALWRSRSAARISSAELYSELVLDVGALTALLWLSGGAGNPFVHLFLLQAVLGAVLLPPRWSWMLVALTAACFAFLIGSHHPIGFVALGFGDRLDLRVAGAFVSFLIAAVLLVLFVSRIVGNLRDRDQRLAELRQQSAEEEHIVRMGLLASGAAHELGTPLGTLSVILNDWSRMPLMRKHPDLLEEIGEMNAALGRCKEIVSHILLASGEARGEGFQRTTVAGFLDSVVAEWKASRAPAHLDYVADIASDVPIAADSVIRQTLFNVLDNALEASPKWVGLEAHDEDGTLIVTVADKGRGFKPDILANFGKPYQSTKPRPGRGLGLFFVVNVLRKLGGRAQARGNRYGGASVELALPIAALALGEEKAA